MNFIEKKDGIWVKSDVPVCQVCLQQPAMASDDLPTAAAPKTILIVEDNTLNLRFFSDLLEHHGYATLTATLGSAGVELAREHRPDLIVLDIQLPDISGMEVARQIKGDPKTRAIPIIAVTAFAMSSDRAQILASGCDDYLAKPFRGSELIRLVELYTV
jgi:two-component system cell cycle response regulator DivK